MLDGTPLTDMISAFESKAAFDVVGGYGGLIPEFFNYGPLDQYFFGKSPVTDDEARIYLLGCECGEVGCWPLTCVVDLQPDTVVWHSFQQPHRPNRDYLAFGRFTFDISQYNSAIQLLSTRFARH